MTAKEFLKECRKSDAFKQAVDAIDNQIIIDFAEAYARLRLSNAIKQSEQLKVYCSFCTEIENI